MISIYALISPITGHVFYIGASGCPEKRLTQHIREALKGTESYKCDEIRRILLSNREIDMEILDKCKLGQTAFWETFYIDLFKSYGFPLRQWRLSAYPKGYDSGKDLCSVTFKVDRSVVEAMKVVADAYFIHRDKLISVALRRYLKKVIYTDRSIYHDINYELTKKFLETDKVCMD